MRPYADGVVTYRVLLDGYERAVERVQAVAVTEGADPGAVYVPLFEALNWAVALDDRTRALWAPTGKALGLHWRDELPAHGPYISAVRYVRNCVHHDWSEAIAVDRGGRRHPRSSPPPTLSGSGGPRRTSSPPRNSIPSATRASPSPYGASTITGPCWLAHRCAPGVDRVGRGVSLDHHASRARPIDPGGRIDTVYYASYLLHA